MRRRDFIMLLGGTAAAWSLAARAQQPAMPVIGFLRSTPAKPFAHIVAAFRQGLNETGFVEAQNVVVEQRWADNQLDQLLALAADLVRRQAAVIVCNGPAVDAARSAAATTPIVFVIGGDAVALGLVASLNRPGGNLTGLTFFGNTLGAKRVDDIHFSDARTITRVQDNLNIHTKASLYEAFPAAEARRLVERFEWHYTPKHGSWLDLAESELGILSSPNASTAAYPTNKPSSTKLPLGSTIAMQTTPRPIGTSRRPMHASNSSIYTLQFD
jgi:ABC transporter substrate binding protein